MVVGAVAGLGAAVTAAGCGAFCSGAAGAPAGDGFDDGCADGIGASDDEAGAVVCCAIALNAISREAVMIHFQVRMAQILSGAQYASWKTTCTIAVESIG